MSVIDTCPLMGVHVSPARPNASAGADCNDGQTFGNKCACYVDCCRGQRETPGVKGVRGGGEEVKRPGIAASREEGVGG